MSHLPVGARLRNGDYTVGSVLARGGFGIVYNGSDTNLQSRVAIKEFFPQGATRQSSCVTPGLVPDDAFAKMRAKFQQEAQALARFDHRGIVRVHTSFAENDTVYAVMAFLEGPTLEGLVEKRGALPEGEALGYIEQIGAALEVVHDAGLIHRDINPSNVMLHADGRAVLIDFGLNQELEEIGLYGTRRLSGTMALGTPGYAPPEQHKSKRETGVFTDIYAVGATLFFLLTGQAPQEVLYRYHEDETLARLQQARVSHAVSDAILQAMALKNAERPQSVAAFLAALHRPSRLSAVVQQPVIQPQEPPPSVRLSATGTGIYEWVNPKDGATMVYVPAGEFLMGSNDCADAIPQHRVYLDGYWIYKTPVTVAQYRQYCQATRRVLQKMPKAPRWGWIDDHPMVHISWHDAQAYCTWAGVRLPSETEWEKAARGTDGRKYPWGNVWDTNRLCCSKMKPGDAGSTSPVGNYPSGASPYGCLDMAGNVWEWCEDQVDDDRWRASRGGSWFYYSPDGVVVQGALSPSIRYITTSNYGFRCAAGHSATSPNVPETAGIPRPTIQAQPIQTKINAKDGAMMVYIPAGNFLMGNDNRQVNVSDYWIYKTPVTVAQYRKFCGATRRTMPDAPGWNWIDDHPVVHISWHDAQAYCTWAGVRLPSETEWEKAARGTNGREYPWGDEWDADRLRCSKVEPGDAGGTSPVGIYPSGESPYGCLDMAGNVWEWCEDKYAAEHEWRVLRGGCWTNADPQHLRTAFRLNFPPDDLESGLDFRGGAGPYGFRCAAGP